MKRMYAAILALLLFISGNALAEARPEAITEFATLDMDGNAVTQDVFAQADLTVINVWATFCGPCISEMPELAAWADELPENVQIIGIIVDVTADTDSTYAQAQAILAQSGTGYQNLLLNMETMYDDLYWITGVPTTLFVDSEGSIVHEEIAGAYVDRYKAVVEEILAQ